MRRFTRLPVPDVLSALVNAKERWVIYGENYQARRIANNGFAFEWPRLNNKRLNQHLLPLLRQQTQNHCSYCDGYPLDTGDHTIDHFKPKSWAAHYPLVCQWENLYIACNRCQQEKKEQYHPDLLRPDDIDFTFNRYFIFDYTTLSIEINPRASPNDKKRAGCTITLLNLNSEAMKVKRQKAYHFYDSPFRPDIDDCDFRYMFESLLPICRQIPSPRLPPIGNASTQRT